MKSLYSNPIRVYIVLAAIALYGIYSGLTLPISLFPNSSKPQIWIGVQYGGATAEEFLNTYGKDLESQLRGISTNSVKVERVISSYRRNRVSFDVKFEWGVDPNEALREAETVVNGFSGRLPAEIRNSVGIWLNNENTGFFALAFYSETRDLNELYDLLEPLLGPRIANVEDAQDPVLWNPTRSEIRIELNAIDMASLQLVPKDIENAVTAVLGGRHGGQVTIGDESLQIQMPRPVRTVEDLNQIPIPTSSGRLVHLSDISRIDVGPQTRRNRSFKTSGSPSLILHSVPKPGGNVKNMSEDLMKVVEEIAPLLPDDVQYRSLVDPSEFIRSAVTNVVHEVILAALLAVAVLFVFIGSFRNVFTAAIEIPMSIVLAFILMKFSDMNLNLISLGGLALSAGMNVDASVVVMENIFRHFENKKPKSFDERLELLVTAVKEVRFAIIAATISSLVVFAPLAFTSDLAFAILGDLAKAVVFSHGFSAFVALILVPTIRLQLMGHEIGPPPKSIIDRPLRRLEEAYANVLSWFLAKPRTKWLVYCSLSVALGALILLVLPRLPKEVIGTPDTDWLILGVNTDGNTMVKQMEQKAQEVERDLLDQFGDRISYTFSQIRHPNRANIMARLKDKSEMKEVWEAMDEHFTNTPFLNFWVGPWNPSELPIPDPPDMRIAVRGGTGKDRALVAKTLWDLLRGKEVFRRISTNPGAGIEKAIVLRPHFEQWEALASSGSRLAPGDLADYLRVATEGRNIGEFPHGNDLVEMNMMFPIGSVETVEAVESFPIGVKSKLIPLKALATVGIEEVEPVIFREDQRELFLVEARQDKAEKLPAKEALANAKKLVAEWKSSEEGKALLDTGITVVFEDAAKDVNDAISQLGTAVGLSVALIFLTLLLQFGTLIEPLVILVSVPLGFIGVLVSLWIFDSTLSLNAALGVILLNGIAVANSIILVDFIKKLVARGRSPREAALEAARKRLRPILITSLTTILGMLPIALGTGEGGHILQPLGIAVSGGLWVSTVLTLVLVPGLQVAYLEREPFRWPQLQLPFLRRNPA